MKKIFVGMLVMFLGVLSLGKLLECSNAATREKMNVIVAMKGMVELTNNIAGIITAFAALGSLFVQDSKDI